MAEAAAAAAADGMRGVLPTAAAAWPFPWNRPPGLQGLEHPSPSDAASSFSRISPTSGSFPQRGEFEDGEECGDGIFCWIGKGFIITDLKTEFCSYSSMV